MFKDIINTIGARYIVAFLNLMLIFINSKVLGREGMGVVGILYASANIAVIFNSILCGNTIVYFMNRYNMRYVFFPAYIWAFIGSLSVCGVMFALNILPEGYEITVFALATLISLFTANTLMVFGKDNVKGFNLAFIIQGLLMFLTLLFMYYVAGYNNITGYLTGLFAAYSTAFIYSFALLFRHLAKNRNRAVAASFFSVLKEMFAYGLWSGVDNLAEGLTTRINYFTVKQMSGGYGNVGLLDSGTKISESVWHISNSVSFIEYGSVSKTTDRQAQKTVTLRLFKLTYCALAVVMAVVVCLPEWLYTDYLMAPEFAGIRKIIIGLAVGVVALGSNRILSHYFIGSGNIRYSAYCSVFGLVVLLFAGFVLIPLYGVFGAAVASSIAYTAMLAFSTVVFARQTDTTFKEFLPSKADWREAVKIIRRFRKSR